MAGKSSLLRSLVNHTSATRLTSEAERTIGLDIQPVTLADPQGRAPSGVEYQVYDAGGHNEYQVNYAILQYMYAVSQLHRAVLICVRSCTVHVFSYPESSALGPARRKCSHFSSRPTRSTS